jgi:coproporphyrinogen III oxidase
LPQRRVDGKALRMTDHTDQTERARAWFEQLRDAICAEFEAIEREAGSDASFDYTPWDRDRSVGRTRRRYVRGVMKGKVFEKVGVNVSTVGGTFEGEFAKTINGAARTRASLRHRDQPGRAHGQPARARGAYEHALPDHDQALVRRRRRSQPAAADRGGYRRISCPMKAACDAHDPTYYPNASRNGRTTYFYIPHRKVHRGVGGIFYDHLDGRFRRNFAFTRDVGEAFLDIYPADRAAADG